MRRGALLLALGIAWQAAAAPPADGMTDYQRFVTYPHLQRGFEAHRRGDAAAALEAFRHARRLAPASPTTALYLADAYRRVGRADAAARVLADQHRKTPADPRFAPARAKGAATPPRPLVSTPDRIADRAIPSRPPPAVTPVRHPQAPRHPAPETPEARFARLLRSGKADAASIAAAALIRSRPDDGALLDRLTYQLAEAGAADAATRLLLDAGALAFDVPATRARLGLLVAERPARLRPDDRVRLLRMPGAAAFDVLAAAGDCEAMAQAAARLEHDARAWRAVALCPGTDALAARDAWRRAAAAGPDAATLRALAYAEAAAGDATAALAAWRRVPLASLEPTNLLAAAATAADTGEAAAARTWLDRYDAVGGARDDRYWWLRALSAPDGVTARSALERAVALRDDPRYLARLAQYLRNDGDTSGAVAALERARALAPTDPELRGALGYAYLAAGRHADALPELEAYRHAHPDSAVVTGDLVEVNRRLVRPARAREMARTAIGLLDPAADADRIHRLRRMGEDLSRRWSLTADMVLGDVVSTAANAPGNAFRSYAQVEAHYRLGHAAGRPDGDALTVYARTFAGSIQGGILPDDGATAGVGLRWKPFATRLVYLAVERQRVLASGSGETMLRLSASPFADPELDRDWHPSDERWWSRSVYLDVAHYVGRDTTAATADVQLGRQFRQGDRWTLEPYGRVQANGLAQQGRFDHDVRIGVGLRLNAWSGGSRYIADPHRFALGVEAQHAVSTYLPDRQTLLFTISQAW